MSLKNLQNFTGKGLCWSLVFQQKCFPVNIAKFIRASILKKHLRTTASMTRIYTAYNPIRIGKWRGNRNNSVFLSFPNLGDTESFFPVYNILVCIKF